MSSSYMEPLVVVVGGAGYIGSTLVRLLLNENFRVRVYDNLLFGYDGLEEIDDSRFEFVYGDICNTCAVSNAITGADTVILLAAVVGRRVEDIRRTNMRDIDLLASSVVLDASVEHGASRFIFASTDSVYGTQDGVMYETGTPEPVSLYSRLKLRMEERVINARRRGFHPVALRIATCHGYSPRMRFDLLANSLIRNAVFRKEIEIVSGEQWRPLVHVEDAAQAFMGCIRAHVNLISGEIFNVGSNEQNVQVKQVAHVVKELIPDTELRIIEQKPDLGDYHLSCSKIEKILDFSPKWTLESSLAHMRDMLLENHFENPYSLMYLNT